MHSSQHMVISTWNYYRKLLRSFMFSFLIVHVRPLARSLCPWHTAVWTSHVFQCPTATCSSSAEQLCLSPVPNLTGQTNSIRTCTDRVPPPARTRQRLPISLRVKAEVPTRPTGFHDLVSCFLLTHLLHWSSLASAACAKQNPTSGPLHLLFPLPPTPFPQVLHGLFPWEPLLSPDPFILLYFYP